MPDTSTEPEPEPVSSSSSSKRPAPADDSEQPTLPELPKPKRPKTSHVPQASAAVSYNGFQHILPPGVPLPYALLSVIQETKLTIEKERRKLDRLELKLDLLMANFARAYELENKLYQAENEIAEMKKWRAVAVEVMGDLMKSKKTGNSE